MDELIEFFKAQLDAEEETLRRGFSHPGRWVVLAVPGMPDGIPNGISCTAVLAEIEADRRLIAAYGVVARHAEKGAVDSWHGNQLDGRREGLGFAVRLRAARFADDPSYKEEWRG